MCIFTPISLHDQVNSINSISNAITLGIDYKCNPLNNTLLLSVYMFRSRSIQRIWLRWLLKMNEI